MSTDTGVNGVQDVDGTRGPRPTVSAVIATHDRPQLLREAIEGVRVQTYDGVLECVVVFDRNEPDETLVSDDPRRPVVVLRNARTPGLAGARNTGALAARGELLAFCDDDDVWLPDKTSAQVDILDAEPDRQVVVGGMVIDYEGDRIERVWPSDEVTVADLCRSRVQDAHPSTVLVRTTAFTGDIGLVDEAIPGSYGEDHDWLIRAAKVHPLAYVRRPLAVVAWHRASHFSGRWPTMIEALDYLIDKHPELRQDSRGLANLRGRQAFARAAMGDRRAAMRTAFESLRLNPLDRRAAVALVVSTGLLSVTRAQRMANAVGRGI
ncbi:glycosyltransferase family 2 protein [Euzebya sp.]|uniref:glycosyltransferase family 2 protein n=1 Tax=Euzebya sp. TaxID=1971409 RepID=UPI003511D193